MKEPITVRISYAALKEALRLPADVDVLGIPGIDDMDGCFPLVLETPARHIKRTDMRCEYRSGESGVEFVGFR